MIPWSISEWVVRFCAAHSGLDCLQTNTQGGALGYHLSAYGPGISVHQRQSAVDGASHLRDDAIPPAGMERSPVQGRVDFRCLKIKRLRDFQLLARGLQLGPRVPIQVGWNL